MKTWLLRVTNKIYSGIYSHIKRNSYQYRGFFPNNRAYSASAVSRVIVHNNVITLNIWLSQTQAYDCSFLCWAVYTKAKFLNSVSFSLKLVCTIVYTVNINDVMISYVIFSADHPTLLNRMKMLCKYNTIVVKTN